MSRALPHSGCVSSRSSSRRSARRPAATTMAATALLVCLVVLAAAPRPAAAASGGGWKSGRATFYGNEPWAWCIMNGSCGKGYMWPDQSTGWDVAALSDAHPAYAGSCGRCYEVRCDPRAVTDGYGQHLDRSGACRRGSVVVRTTDTCPCSYPGNYYSNKRWCCGDQDHLDMSVWAFSKLADQKWGVIGVQYREVDCAHAPEERAAAAGGAEFPGVFPSEAAARARPGFDWQRWFPNSGYYGCLGAGAADGRGCRHISTAEFLAKAGLGGGGGDGSGSGSGNSTSTASGGGGGGGGGLAPSAQYGK